MNNILIVILTLNEEIFLQINYALLRKFTDKIMLKSQPEHHETVDRSRFKFSILHGFLPLEVVFPLNKK